MIRQANLRFYAELRDFLPEDVGSGEVVRSFGLPGSVKDMIESCGIPHTEVDLILANGCPVDFSYLVEDGDRIGVFPRFRSIDITSIVNVRPRSLPQVRFLADNHLGRLARFLRLLGLDASYAQDWSDPELVEISISEERILLTRDIQLLKHGSLVYGYYVRATDPREQMTEVVRRFRLSGQLVPFSRCMVCNGILAPAAKEDVAHRLPAETQAHVDDYAVCTTCGQVYWEGAHHTELIRLVAAARQADPRNEEPEGTGSRE